MEQIDVSEVKILFERGLLGFEYLRYFQVTKLSPDYPFFYLQSVEEEALCFLTLNPFALTKNYEFELTDPAQEALDVKDLSDVAVLNIINTTGGLDNATVNLQAPVVINVRIHKGMQVVLNDNKLNLKEPLENLLQGTGGK